ncbi:MAG: hypothetical protein LBC84_01890 [Prevotellaceae bacterium]|jgi:hypothetical protein|nr:hypothetical protein [Prevotellaceae bacterium]
MKTLYFKPFVLSAALLTTACNPTMDAPTKNSMDDPTRPGAPPQVIYLPEGVEVTSLAVDGNHLYATAPKQDQVYRFDISNLMELSRTATAVPYAKVPGANGIAAGANNTLFIGSSGDPKPGATTHKWTSDQVIYVTQATESWHSRFFNCPAQKLFVAPRGSFNALTVYNGSLYYAANSDLEGMTINTTDRISKTLGAIENLVPKEFQFLVDLALGNADFSNMDYGTMLNIARQFHLYLPDGFLDNLIDDNGNLKMDLEDLPLEMLENFVTFDYNIDLPTDALDFLRFLLPSPNSIPFIIPIHIPVSWNINFFNIAIIPINFNIDFDLTIYVPVELTLTPQWGLHLVTLWYGLLEVDESIIKDLVDGLLSDTGLIDNIVTTLRNEAMNYLVPYVRDQVYGGVRGIVNTAATIPPISWFWSGNPDTDPTVLSLKDIATEGIMVWIAENGYITGPVNSVINAELITTNFKNYEAWLSVINEYRKPGGILSLNGTYKDQFGELPQRPYVLSPTGEEPWNPWKSDGTPKPIAEYGVPISPDFANSYNALDDRTMNQKLALTLHLLKFKDQETGNPFALVSERSQYDRLVTALDDGNMLNKIKTIVEILEIDNIKKVIKNDQIIEYLNFLDAVSQVTGFDNSITVALDALYELITHFDDWGVRIPDFQTIIQAWEGLPDWGNLNGTRAGAIAPHELLGSLYQQMDNFVDGLGNPWSTVAGWVTGRIPRVNSAQGWWYDWSPTNPTGIAFGEVAGVGTTSWVVDRGRLYSRHINYGGKGGGARYLRDDYPHTPEYPAPSSPPWSKSGFRWELVTPGQSGQDKTDVTASNPVILDHCHSVIFDNNPLMGGRVLVSCDDGETLLNKGRIVSVTYSGWSPFNNALSAAYGFYPPPPRLPLAPPTLTGANANYEIHEFVPADGTLNHPKGMAIKNNYLFIADGDRIVVYYMGSK